VTPEVQLLLKNDHFTVSSVQDFLGPKSVPQFSQEDHEVALPHLRSGSQALQRMPEGVAPSAEVSRERGAPQGPLECRHD
jgi:hypothetical protein